MRFAYRIEFKGWKLYRKRFTTRFEETIERLTTKVVFDINFAVS